MVWIMAALWLFLIIGIIILIKRHYIIVKENKIKLNEKFRRKVDVLENEYQSRTESLEREYNQKRDFIEENYKNEVCRLSDNLVNKRKELQLVEHHCNELKQFGEQQIDNNLKLYEEMKRKELENQLAADRAKQYDEFHIELNNFIASAAETKKSVNEEIEELKLLLEDYKSKRDLINQAIVHEKEIHEQQDFYRIILNESDKEDIQILNTVEMRLRNRESLYKLILDVFYKKPLDDMLNRVLEGKEFCGIYRITNLKTNESYIGKSTNIKNRFKQHIRTAIGLDGVARTKIHSAMKEYGIDNFSFEVLEKCTKEIYSEREKYWINFYETNIYGYNIQK